VINRVKDRVVGSTTDLFSHGPQPLEHTLNYAGDPGILGPGSVSWRVVGDASAFVAGIRALLVQTAHPEVVAGVENHSRYRSDPLGRLTRTSAYVTATTYGAGPEVAASVALVRNAHLEVKGHSVRGKAYSAENPAMTAWVHNVLTDSFLTAYQSYGRDALSPQEADQFVLEQTRIGALLDASPLPTDATSLRSWVCDHAAIASSAAQRDSIQFLRNPPLPPQVKVGYRLLLKAAIATVPPGIATVVGVQSGHLDGTVGAATVRALRWALGSSPAWHVALVRSGAPVPDGMFRQTVLVDS
jgi:uncharacterized protein (DUF2236 family)